MATSSVHHFLIFMGLHKHFGVMLNTPEWDPNPLAEANLPLLADFLADHLKTMPVLHVHMLWRVVLKELLESEEKEYFGLFWKLAFEGSFFLDAHLRQCSQQFQRSVCGIFPCERILSSFGNRSIPLVFPIKLSGCLLLQTERHLEQDVSCG